MVVIKCDKCGATVSDADELKKVKRLKAYSVKQKPPFSDDTLPEKFDLCGDCYALVKELINPADTTEGDDGE